MTAKTQALRFNRGKLQLHYMLTFPEAMRGVARISTYGATKYALYNYTKGAPASESIACAMRHLTAWWNGEDVDRDDTCLGCINADAKGWDVEPCKNHSNCNHLDAYAWNANRLCDEMHRKPQFDDRPHVVLAAAEAKKT